MKELFIGVMLLVEAITGAVTGKTEEVQLTSAQATFEANIKEEFEDSTISCKVGHTLTTGYEILWLDEDTASVCMFVIADEIHMQATYFVDIDEDGNEVSESDYIFQCEDKIFIDEDLFDEYTTSLLPWVE